MISGSTEGGAPGVRRDEARLAAAVGGALWVAPEAFVDVDAGSAAIFVRGILITDVKTRFEAPDTNRLPCEEMIGDGPVEGPAGGTNVAVPTSIARVGTNETGRG